MPSVRSSIAALVALAAFVRGKLTTKQADSLLNFHNLGRANTTIAKSGSTTLSVLNNFKCATDMGCLEWDAKLATGAQYHADKCVFKHSTADDRTAAYVHAGGENLYLGENIAAYSGDSAVDSGLNGWWDEHKDYAGPDCDTSKGSCNCDGCEGAIGHFTQMAWSEATRIGCGQTADCPNMFGVGLSGALLVCQYFAPKGKTAGNMQGMPTWKTGTCPSVPLTCTASSVDPVYEGKPPPVCDAGCVVGIIFAVIAVIAVAVLVFLYMKKKGPFKQKDAVVASQP